MTQDDSFFFLLSFFPLFVALDTVFMVLYSYYFGHYYYFLLVEKGMHAESQTRRRAEDTEIIIIIIDINIIINFFGTYLFTAGKLPKLFGWAVSKKPCQINGKV